MLYTNELAVSLLADLPADLQCRPPVSVFTSHTCTTSPFCTVKLNNNNNNNNIWVWQHSFCSWRWQVSALHS